MANLSRIRPGPPARRRLCFAVDIESFSGRIQPQQLDLMRRLLWIMTVACENAGVSASRCERQDSGDGQILVLPPGVDESTVLPGFVLGLLTALKQVNETPGSGGRLRLRVSLGQGNVQMADTGLASHAVATVCRLLDSADLRAALAGEQAADAAFVVTDDLYADLVMKGYGGLPADAFRKIHVETPAKQFAADGWIQVPLSPALVPGVPDYSEASTGIITATVMPADDAPYAAETSKAGLRAASAHAWASLVKNKGRITTAVGAGAAVAAPALASTNATASLVSDAASATGGQHVTYDYRTDAAALTLHDAYGHPVPVILESSDARENPAGPQRAVHAGEQRGPFAGQEVPERPEADRQA